MKLKSLMTATITATLLATASMAQTTDPIQAIVDGLAAAGYTQIHITKKMNKIEVVAIGPNGAIEQTYTRSGTLVESETTSVASAQADIAEAASNAETDDNGTDDNEVDDNEADDNGSDDNGSDDNGSDDNGADDNGSDDDDDRRSNSDDDDDDDDDDD